MGWLTQFLVSLFVQVAAAQEQARVTREAYIRAKREAERIEEERGLK